MRLKKFLAVFVMLLSVFALSAHADSIYNSEPSFSPYYAGSVKSDVLYEALREINYIRWLVGVPNNVTLNDEYTRKAQHGAVLLDATDILTHFPEKPSDMSTEFYDLGYDATSHGNIAVSKIYSGSDVRGNITLSRSTKLYMADSDNANLARLGHRRWLMNPRLKQTGFGISTRRGYAVTYVVEDFDNPSQTLSQEEYARYLEWLKWPISDEYITWPTNKHPHPLSYFWNDTAWSVTLNSEIFDEASSDDVSVRITRQSDGKMWTFGKNISNGYFNVTDASVAYDQCIIFRPDGIERYNDKETFSVQVFGLKKKNAGTASISYSVQFTSEATEYDDNSSTQNQNQSQNQNQDINNNSDEKNSGGGCNASSGIFTALITLGIPRRKLRAGR